MASRSVGRVVLSFGMAQIAIKLYKAAGAESVSFNMISPKNRCRVGQRLFEKLPESTDSNVVWGEEVQRSEILKGYEYAKDQYVIFTDEEVENMQAAKKDSLDIAEFVPSSEIDPLHIEQTYYTAPDKGMDKGYKFLYELLKAHGKAAVGTYVARGKEHLVAIRAYQHGLIMHQMFYDTEVRSFDNKCANVPISPVEMAMGKVLMDTLSKPTFDSSKYSDKFIEKLNAAVQVKLENPNATITEVSTPVQNTGMADALRASLRAIGMSEDKIAEEMAKIGVIPASSPVVVTETSEPVAMKVTKPSKTRTKKAS
jgi:DNA end-binding protein Ku